MQSSHFGGHVRRGPGHGERPIGQDFPGRLAIPLGGQAPPRPRCAVRLGPLVGERGPRKPPAAGARGETQSGPRLQ